MRWCWRSREDQKDLRVFSPLITMFPGSGASSRVLRDYLHCSSNGCHSVDYVLQFCFISIPSSSIFARTSARVSASSSDSLLPHSLDLFRLMPASSYLIPIPASTLSNPVVTECLLLPNESRKCSIHYLRNRTDGIKT